MGFFLCLLVAWLTGCGSADDIPRRDTAAIPVVIQDDAGVTIRLPAPARRIVSLMPSATETIVALGGADFLVARTRYDDDPRLAGLPSVGSGLEPSLERVVALEPDLVVVWSVNQHSEIRARLAAVGIPVMGLDVQDTASVFRAIAVLGTALGEPTAAIRLADSLRRELSKVVASVSGRARPRVLYVVYHDPPMTAGAGTFITELLDVAGAENVFGDVPTPWPTVSLEEVMRRDPDAILVPTDASDGPSPDLLRADAGWRKLRAVRSGRVFQVPSDLTNRPGPNMIAAARLLRDLLHGAKGDQP